MPTLIKKAEIRSDFKGIIKILADSLYAEKDVFIRELIQNAHDAIVERKTIEQDLFGHIDIYIDSVNSIITFRDNGVGMDEKDIEDFFAVIGSSGKDNTRSRLMEEGKSAAYELIGQFGIGMLSSFVVASKVIVRTKKIDSPIAYAWHNDGSLDYDLYTDDKEDDGTEFIIHIRKDYQNLLEEDTVKEAIIKYCDFIQFPISLNGKGAVNAIDAPWYQENWTSEAQKQAKYKNYIYSRFPDFVLEIIPIEINKPYKVRGVLFVSDQAGGLMEDWTGIKILVKRMFILANDDTILPVWAKFISGILDIPDLKVTTARDNILRDKAIFNEIQSQLGNLIIEHLIYLSEHDPDKFDKINRWHFFHIKSAALKFKDFFDKVIKKLFFDTNKGRIPLEKYLTLNAPRPQTKNKIPIYFFTSQGSALQFYQLADAKGWVVINAGAVFDAELLKKFAQQNNALIHLSQFDVSDDPELFERLDIHEQEKFNRLAREMEVEFKSIDIDNIRVRMRRFMPVELPAVIIQHAETEAERKLKDLNERMTFFTSIEDLTEQLASEQSNHHPVYLCVNASHKLIQNLADIFSDGTLWKERSGMLNEIISGIYNSAILYSHNLLTQHNAKIIHSQLIRLFGRLISYQQNLGKLQGELESARLENLQLRSKSTVRASNTSQEHIILFMITPFKKEYSRVEEAVRRIFECPPYYFQVRLARDYQHEASLLDNIRTHMIHANGFIAEISDLNPNVMFELGAVMLPDDERPVFPLRYKDAEEEVPSDIKEKIYINYSTINNDAEAIEKEIRKEIEGDGQIKHSGITKLIDQRKKKYLSTTYLKNLSRVRLSTGEIAKIKANYNTIEDLLAIDVNTLAQQLSIPDFQCVALKGELKS